MNMLIIIIIIIVIIIIIIVVVIIIIIIFTVDFKKSDVSKVCEKCSSQYPRGQFHTFELLLLSN